MKGTKNVKITWKSTFYVWRHTKVDLVEDGILKKDAFYLNK